MSQGPATIFIDDNDEQEKTESFHYSDLSKNDDHSHSKPCSGGQHNHALVSRFVIEQDPYHQRQNV